MGYRPRSVPDYSGYLLSLKEMLEAVLQQLNEDDSAGVSPDVSCLEAYDQLNQFLDGVKQDLGI